MSLTRTLALSALFAAPALAGGPIPPTIELLGERFIVVDAGYPASMGIAYRASDETVLTGVGHVFSCSGSSASNAQGDQGTSLDPVTNTFWFVNSDGVVRRVLDESAGTSEIVFTIPPSFTVPGAGTQSVHAVGGLALDDEFVYIVDAGPDRGEIESNQWFKFERDGTPVSSSHLTDFNDHLDFGFDAVVDGLEWIPPTAPYGAGLFLVAVEHSGILVIDEDGFFVDRLDWADHGLELGSQVPFAFAGLSINPERGDLYLAENSGGACFVWERVIDTTKPFLAVTAPGTISVHAPDQDCYGREMIWSIPDDPVFALSYNSDDGYLWGIDFNFGNVYRVDPRSGLPELMGLTEINLWGLDWAATRGVFFANRTGHLRTLDLSSFATTPLPNAIGFPVNDIAYHPARDKLYGFDRGSTSSQLIEIDPDTGIGSAILTLSGSFAGVDYDPASDDLFVVEQVSGAKPIYRLDLESGTVSTATEFGLTPYWETLTVVPTTLDSSVGVGSPGAAIASVTLGTAFPNPFTPATTLGFTLDSIEHIAIDVFDVSGRRLTALLNASLTPGRHEVSWDGRNEAGRRVAPGVYHVVLETALSRTAQRVVLLR